MPEVPVSIPKHMMASRLTWDRWLCSTLLIWPHNLIQARPSPSIFYLYNQPFRPCSHLVLSVSSVPSLFFFSYSPHPFHLCPLMAGFSLLSRFSPLLSLLWTLPEASGCSLTATVKTFLLFVPWSVISTVYTVALSYLSLQSPIFFTPKVELTNYATPV